MARTSNTLPPEIASKLADVARELREHIYGEQAVIDKNGQHETTLDTPAGEVEWKQPKTRLKKSRRDFFTQAQALGLDVDEMLSPSLLDISLGHQSLERITERIGAERLVEADQEVAAFQALTLMEKLAVVPPKPEMRG